MMLCWNRSEDRVWAPSSLTINCNTFIAIPGPPAVVLVPPIFAFPAASSSALPLHSCTVSDFRFRFCGGRLGAGFYLPHTRSPRCLHKWAEISYCSSTWPQSLPFAMVLLVFWQTHFFITFPLAGGQNARFVAIGYRALVCWLVGKNAWW